MKVIAILSSICINLFISYYFEFYSCFEVNINNKYILLESTKFKIRNLQMNVLASKLRTNRVVNIKLKIHQDNEIEKC